MYDDSVRENDAAMIDARRAIKQDAVYNALALFVLDPLLRRICELLDPKAMEQARQALGLTKGDA